MNGYIEMEKRKGYDRLLEMFITVALTTSVGVFLFFPSSIVLADEYNEQQAFAHHRSDELLVFACSFSEDCQDLITIPVYLNGQGPYLFYLDSGAFGTVSTQLVGELNLIPTAESSEDCSYVNFASLILGEIEIMDIKDQRVTDIIPPSPFLLEELQGSIGGEVLRRSILTIDYPQNVLRIYASNQPAQMMYDLYLQETDGKSVVGLQCPQGITYIVYPLVRVEINGEHPALMLVDTCSGMTVLDDGYAQSIGILPVEEMGTILAFGSHGEKILSQSVIGELCLGEKTVKELPCLLDDERTWLLGDFADEPVVGILGVDFLSNYKITINYRRGEMVLE